jgi:hypothetical protein
MSVRLRNIAEWRAIAVNPAVAQILRDQSAPQPKQPLGLRYCGLIQRWRKLEPMRRTKPRHAPALLIYHNGRMPAHGGAQIGTQLPNLRRILKISRKENKSKGLNFFKKTALSGSKKWTSATKNEWGKGHD